VFYHPSREIYTMVHGDDYVNVGEEPQLKWMKIQLEKQFEVKSDIIGPNAHQRKEVKVLNRFIRYGKYGIQYEPDPRHAEIIISEMGVQAANPVSTPGQEIDDTPEGEIRDESTDTNYRAITARANYLAIDRPDIQYSTKEVCRSMSAPTKNDWEKLKRLSRYLVGKPRIVQHFKYQEYNTECTVYTDANWAGCKKTRKSTSAGAICIGDHCLKTWSKTQATIATSSAEAELYAATRGTQEAMGVTTMLGEMGFNIQCRLMCDASAALAIIQRRGVGKTKHVNVQWLWVQQVARREQIKFNKIHGTHNPADAMTKYLTKQTMERHMTTLGYEFMGGRAEAAARVASDAA
jgi:hypothetical protein